MANNREPSCGYLEQGVFAPELGGIWWPVQGGRVMAGTCSLSRSGMDKRSFDGMVLVAHM